jgi:integration host factor subunit beta
MDVAIMDERELGLHSLAGANEMTKSILIDRLCEKCKVPTGRTEQIVNAIFDSIEQALNRGERIEIRGFGSFEPREYGGYVGRNPRTGSSVEVKPKRLPFFKVGKELKDRIEQTARRERQDRATTVEPARGDNARAKASSIVQDPAAAPNQASAAAS